MESDLHYYMRANRVSHYIRIYVHTGYTAVERFGDVWHKGVTPHQSNCTAALTKPRPNS